MEQPAERTRHDDHRSVHPRGSGRSEDVGRPANGNDTPEDTGTTGTERHGRVVAVDGSRDPHSHGPTRQADDGQQTLIHQLEYRQHAGPLPVPADFSAYEAVLPGAAERIMRMAEDNNAASISDRRRESRAYAVGFVLTSCLPLALVGAGVVLFAFGYDVAGTVVAVAGAIGVVPQIAITVKNVFRTGESGGDDRDNPETVP